METISDKTILVTGGAGYIGSAVVKQLCDLGHKVVVFDNLSTGDKSVLPATVIFVQGDITIEKDIESVFLEHSFDTVIHCVAKKVMSEGESEPTKYFHTNVFGTLNLLNCMSIHKVPKIIFSSTAAVYAPNSEGRPVTESDLTGPVSVYGKSKLMAETLIQEFERLNKINSYTILRYFNVAGDAGLSFKESDAQGVFPLIAKALKNNCTFSVCGTDYDTKDGSGVRDYLHLHDLASAHVQALDSNKSNTYNLGTSNGYSVYELLGMFEKIAGKTISVQKTKRRPGDLASVLANSSLAREELNWKPTKTLKEMVESTLSVYGQ